MFFTNTGRVYVERVHEIPDMGRAAKGRSIANLLELQAGRKIAALIRIAVQDRAEQGRHDLAAAGLPVLRHAAGHGEEDLARRLRQRPQGRHHRHRHRAGRHADRREADDRPERSGADHPRRHEHPLRGRCALDGPAGRRVRGISLEKDDAVVALAVVVPDATLLVAGENGIGKRTPFDEYRVQSRGGKGIITMKTTEKTGGVVGALTVRESDEIMLITAGGQMVRTFVKDIREAGRNTQGVKLINLDAGDKLQAIAPVISEQQEDAASEAEPVK